MLKHKALWETHFPQISQANEPVLEQLMASANLVRLPDKECGLYKIRNILFPELVKARGSSILLGMIIPAYSPEIETQMLNFYESLSEKDRRSYAAMEASKLGYGGASYIRQVLRCDDRTITRGRQELKT
ncbi:MAG: hypothetical protein QX197_08500, partial [Methylococcaceae bacterium]